MKFEDDPEGPSFKWIGEESWHDMVIQTAPGTHLRIKQGGDICFQLSPDKRILFKTSGEIELEGINFGSKDAAQFWKLIALARARPVPVEVSEIVRAGDLAKIVFRDQGGVEFVVDREDLIRSLALNELAR